MRKKVVTSINFLLHFDWKTGKFRGYICQKCNTGIGNLQDGCRDYTKSSMEYITNDKN